MAYPHVRDEALCEGNGRAAIRAALAEAKLCDCFPLVPQIISTCYLSHETRAGGIDPGMKEHGVRLTGGVRQSDPVIQIE